MSKRANKRYRIAMYRLNSLMNNVVKGLKQLGYDVDGVYLSTLFLFSTYDDCNTHYAIYNRDTELLIGELTIDKDYRDTLKFDAFTLVCDGKISDDRDSFSLKLLPIGEQTLATI